MTTKYLWITLIGMLLTIGCSACSSDDEPAQDADSKSKVIKFHLELSIGSSIDSRTDISEEDGTPDENFIDLSTVHLYLYSATDRVLSGKYNWGGVSLNYEIIPTEANLVSLSNGTYYINGEIPADVLTSNSFRLAVTANWPKTPYYEDIFKYGSANNCMVYLAVLNNDDFVYNYGADSEGNTTYYEPGVTPMPMFGVMQIDDYTALHTTKDSNGDVYELGQLNLTRALAKIIVEDETNNGVITDVKMTKCMNRGMCAPYGVYQDVNDTSDYLSLPRDLTGDYKDGASTASQKVNGVALGYNYDTALGTITDLPLKKVGNKFVAYVPEFRNVSHTNPVEKETLSPKWGTAQLKVTADGEDYTFDFKDYEDGVATSDVYNIVRNHTYIYKVKIAYNLAYIVKGWDTYKSGHITYD